MLWGRRKLQSCTFGHSSLTLNQNSKKGQPKDGRYTIPKETKDKLMRPIIDQFAAGNCRYQVNENDFFVIIKNRSIYFYLVFWLT